MQRVMLADPAAADGGTDTAEVISQAFQSAGTGQVSSQHDYGLETTHGQTRLVMMVEDMYRSSRDDAYWERRGESELNRAFYRNKSYAIWYDDTHELDEDPPSSNPYEKRFQYPLFTNFVITGSSRIAAAHPVVLVHPAAGDQVSADNALVCQRGLDYEWNRQDVSRTLARASVPWMLDGTMVLACEYDPSAGPIEEETGLPRGEIVTRHVRTHNFLIDPAAVEGVNDAMWCGEASRQSCARIFSEWGVAVQPDGWSDDDRINVEGSRHMQVDRTTVIRIWLKPGRYRVHDGVLDLPRGAVTTIANGKILEEPKANPYEHGRFPYHMAQALPNDASPFGETIYAGLRPLQVALDKTMTQAADANEHMAMPVWLEPLGAEMTDADFVGRSGLRMRFDESAGLIPMRVDGKGAAPSVYKMIDLIIKGFSLVTGITEGGMLGGAPVNVESGVGLEALTERDTSRLAITALALGGAVRWWGETTLALVRQFWSTPRMIRVAGRMAESEVFMFSSTNVEDGQQVRVVAESLEPQSRMSKMQETLALLQHGIISIEDAKFILARDVITDQTEYAAQLNAAKDEGLQAELYGRIFTPVEAMALEDHDTHLKQHYRDMQKPENRPGPNGISIAWLALLAHVQVHHQLQWDQYKAVSGGAREDGDSEMSEEKSSPEPAAATAGA